MPLDFLLAKAVPQNKRIASEGERRKREITDIEGGEKRTRRRLQHFNSLREIYYLKCREIVKKSSMIEATKFLLFPEKTYDFNII